MLMGDVLPKYEKVKITAALACISLAFGYLLLVLRKLLILATYDWTDL